MNAEQKQRAQEARQEWIDYEWSGADSNAEFEVVAIANKMAALLQDLIDAPEQAGVPFWHVVVSKQAPFIDRAIRREDVAQEYAAEQRENGLHDVTVIPLYAAPQAPERAAQSAGVPDDETVAAQARYMAVRVGLPSYGNSGFGPWQPAPMPKEGDLLKGVDSVGYAYEIRLLYAAPQAPAVQADLRDAERYRWLRDPDSDVSLVIDKRTTWNEYDEGTRTGGHWNYEYRAGDELDAAIDAARAAQKGGES